MRMSHKDYTAAASTMATVFWLVFWYCGSSDSITDVIGLVLWVLCLT